jgi:hypothetical protein
MGSTIVGDVEITETYPNGSPKTEEQQSYNPDTGETTVTTVTYGEGKGNGQKGKRKRKTRLTLKAAPGPEDPRARRNKLREVIEEFDADGDQIVKEIETTYDGTVNEIPKEKFERDFYTDPKSIKRETRFRWSGAAWVKESDYTFDRDGTQHKQ